MDKTLKDLLRLTREGTVEHRCAALLVLGAMQLQDPPVVEAASAGLAHANVVLQDYALRYFEQAQPKASIPVLLPLLDEPDKDLRERGTRLLVGFGQAAVRPLLQHMKSASRVGHLQAAQVLCAIRGPSAWRGLLSLLSDGESEFNKAVCDLIITTLREMEDKEQDILYAELEAWASALDPQAQRAAVISALRLLGHFGRPQARTWLFAFVGPDQPGSVRFQAVVALLHCLRGQELRKEERSRLLAILEEPQFSDSVRLTLDLLDAQTLPPDTQPLLSKLVESPHIAVQKFALRKLGEFGSPAVVRTLVEQLGDEDAARRDAAARALRKIPTARATLTKEFLTCDDPRKAWAIAEVLPTYQGKWRQDALDGMWDRLRAALDDEERIHGAYLHMLKNVDSEYVYKQLAARGAQLSKGKHYKEAVRVLSLLKDFPVFAPEDKFRLAVAQLKLHPHAVVPQVQRQEPALELLADLSRSSAFPVLDALRKDTALEPEKLFYVGFCFAERTGEERALGEGILEMLASRFPRSKVGKSARNKLKLLGG